MNRLIGIAVILVLLVAWPGVGAALAQPASPLPQATAQITAPETSDGVIEGKVQSGTKDAQVDLSQPLEVMLLSFTGDQESPPVTTKTAPDGTFRFENLLTGSNRDYVVLVTYRNVEVFSRERLRFSPDQKKLTVTVPVYETTTKRDAIKVQRTHFILDFPADRTLRVGEQ